ncbi:MAG: ABC transporter ATP-binding protein [Thermofilaceae archaeon]|nr:ABC transporter ATP-binding protein [Thermofilaceae archaeon]
MNTLLQVENLTKIFNIGFFSRKEIVAVDNVNFDVKEGEIISLVGESGSGKTTTAKIILRLIPPSRGTVKFLGRDVWSLKTREELKWYWRNVHGVFQDPYASFNPVKKVDNFLYQVFNLYDRDELNITGDRESIVRDALKAVGLRPEYVLGKYPHELSGGMRQRIMVARCFMLKPKLVVADEPTSMIDASTRAGVLKLFLSLRDEYKTSVIFITHDLGLAYYVSDRILIMYKGRLVEEKSPDDLLEKAEHPYTRKLLSDVPLLYRRWN